MKFTVLHRMIPEWRPLTGEVICSCRQGTWLYIVAGRCHAGLVSSPRTFYDRRDDSHGWLYSPVTLWRSARGIMTLTTSRACLIILYLSSAARDPACPLVTCPLMALSWGCRCVAGIYFLRYICRIGHISINMRLHISSFGNFPKV